MDFTLKHTLSYISVKEYIANYLEREKFIALCKECPSYGKVWSCPPFGFDLDKYLESYNHLYIFGTQIFYTKEVIEKSIVDKEFAREYSNASFNKTIQLLLSHLLKYEMKYPNTKAFSVRCLLCEECACKRLENKRCIHPDKMRYSLESFGFNIQTTASDLLHIELKWSKDGSLPEYNTLVTALFSKNEIDKISLPPLR